MQAKIFETLKTVLRARKMTYADLAEKLGTSEPTVKRIFSARDDKLSRILEICDVLEVSLDDILEQTKRKTIKTRVLSDQVEMKLAEDPMLLYVVSLLAIGVPMREIEQQLSLSKDELFRIGCRLERLGLVEVQHTGEIKWQSRYLLRYRADGPLRQLLMEITINFVKSTFSVRDLQHSGFIGRARRISEDTGRHMMAELRRLNREFSELSHQDQLTLPDEDLKTYMFCVALAQADLQKILPFPSDGATSKA